ncbi:hypothetical protein HANVADRAFT_53042 [Hanseniaspora valbyensis NRRL Y-1626]|uniref:Uncharacterized protein n=1 Tax=Hanseniaspora valbyensis NRRL Y-1626 TaxID=766949 RepID=A0A1B7TCV1_9ASCO|nr:hypothetical protein HANVADRAFT_53042 [Hanseniaspora valbyensis NRRL Y-1626]
MISSFENIKKQLQKQFKPQAYYKNLIISDQNYFNEYVECVQIDEKNAEQVFDQEENLKEKIFNLVCSIMIKKRDSLLIEIKKQFNFKSFIKKSIVMFILISTMNFFFFVFTYLFVYREAGFQEEFQEELKYNLKLCVFLIVVDFISYEIVSRRIEKKFKKNSYELYDNDIREYYDTKGESVFGNNFFLSDDINSSNGINNDFKIQIFKDKMSNQLNSVSIVKPLIERDDKIIMSIGFMGTLTDSKLMYTIFDKMIDNIIFDYELLKEACVDKKVELEFISRGIDNDLLNFLIKCKGFKNETQVTNSYKNFKGFNKFRYIKKT